MQRQEDLRVRATERLQRDQLAADGDLPLPDLDVDALAHHARALLRRRCQDHALDVLLLCGQHQRRAVLDDPGLHRRDVEQRVAEVALVVHRDRRDDRDLAVRDVGRVPQTAHADLDHRDVHRCVRERRERHHREDLEERQLRLALRRGALVDQVDVRRHVLPHLDEPLVADRLAVDDDPLVHARQVRAGEPAGAQAVLADQPLDHA